MYVYILLFATKFKLNAYVIFVIGPDLFTHNFNLFLFMISKYERIL